MAGKGGTEPNLEELVLTGPFKGFDQDTSHWYIGPGPTFNRSQNVDYLKGQIQQRAGVTRAWLSSGVSLALASATTNTAAPPNFDSSTSPNVSDPELRFLSHSQGSAGLIFGRWGVWTNSGTGWGTNISLPSPATSIYGNNKGKYACWTYLDSSSPDPVDVSAAGAVTPSGAGTFALPREIDCAGAFIKFSGDASWYLITGCNPSGPSLGTAYVGAGLLNQTWTIAVPLDRPSAFAGPPAILWGNMRCFCREEATGSIFFGGFPGGSMLKYSTDGAVGGTFTFNTFMPNQTTPLGTPAYVAKAAAFYGGRLVVATPQSRVCSTTGAAWAIDNHPGRIAYSSNRSYSEFDQGTYRTAGAFDTSLGDIFAFFVLRDTLYGVAANGIFSVQRTGNSYMPFRYSVVDDSQIMLDCGSDGVAVVEASYAMVPTANGMMRFDGSRLQPIKGAMEFFRGNPLGGPICYDSVRRRVVAMLNPNYNANKFAVLDLDGDGWSTWYFNPSASGVTQPVVLKPAYNLSSGEQTEEYAMICTDGFYVGSRATVLDRTASLSWELETAILDPQKSRDRRSATRIRVSYEATTSNSTTVSVQLFTDGGVTAATTQSLTLTGGSAGQFLDAYVTFAPVTGQKFNVVVAGTGGYKVKINQVAIYFVERQEQRPN